MYSMRNARSPPRSSFTHQQAMDKENYRQQQQQQQQPQGASPSSVVLQAKTPPGSSKLLRQHFAQLSLSPKQKSTSTRRRRLLDAGPVRILHPDYGDSSTVSSSESFLTSCWQQHLLTQQESTTTTTSSAAAPRTECMDPVALTLMMREQDTTVDHLQSWSTNLSHLYGTTDGMAKPIPMPATPTNDYHHHSPHF